MKIAKAKLTKKTHDCPRCNTASLLTPQCGVAAIQMVFAGHAPIGLLAAAFHAMADDASRECFLSAAGKAYDWAGQQKKKMELVEGDGTH